jgi:hypothetical protein
MQQGQQTRRKSGADGHSPDERDEEERGMERGEFLHGIVLMMPRHSYSRALIQEEKP